MNEIIKTKIVVIGSGPSGYSAAFRCSDLGLDTILIERFNNLGGVCLNVGCIPSKALLHISKIIEEINFLIKQGIINCKFKKDIIKIREWKNNIINKLNIGLLNLSKKRNIKIIFGTAKFKTTNSLIVNNNNKNTLINYKYAILATGSKPINLPFLKKKTINIWDSNDALKLNEIPLNLLIIGGGVIGLEMSYIYSSLGSKIDIVESNNQILPEVDKDISKILYNIIKKKIKIILDTKIIDIKIKNNLAFVKMQKNNKIVLKEYNKVLIAIGRKPNTNDINIKEIGIKQNNNGFIIVDKQLRTNINNIFAIGDITGQPMLAHKGIHEGHIAASVISGLKHVIFEKKIIPSVVYTNPEVAWVGITEKIAIKKNIKYKISNFPWSVSGRAIISNCKEGVTKLIFDKNTDRIIGGAIVGTNGGELLGEISLAIEMGCYAEDIALTIHAHPTLNESIGLASEIYLGTITDILNKNSFK